MSLIDDIKALRGRLTLANDRKSVIQWMADADDLLEKATMNQPCEHNFQFQGVVYHHGYQLAGSGACARFYSDRYFCTKCLQTADRNKREHGDSYQRPIDGTMPA